MMAMQSKERSRHDKMRPAGHARSVQRPSYASSAIAVNPLKSKIRDINRALEHSDRLPPGVRIEKERALAGYRQDLLRAQEAKRRQNMIQKYHMVRFFERQKATRNLKKIRNGAVSENCDQVDDGRLQEELHTAEVDLNYTIFYPLDQKYVSLFPRSGNTSLGDTERKPSVVDRPSMWKVVETCMREGTLDKLRNGKIDIDNGSNEKSVQGKDANSQASSSVELQDARKRTHDDSDDEFFEA